MSYENVSFRPVSVKEVFTEMKDTAELMIDLSYSAVFSDDGVLADEVLGLEEKMDRLQYRARMSMMLSARNQKEAERLAPLMAIIGATEDISNAAGDIAKIVKKGESVPPSVRRMVSDTFEPIISLEVDPSSEIHQKKYEDVFHPAVHILAVRREGEWYISPDFETVQEADRILLKGPEEELSDLIKDRDVFEDSEDLEEIEKVVDTVTSMKDFSELAVDLSYSSVFSGSRPIAEEVQELEKKIDSQFSEMIDWVLKAAESSGVRKGLKSLLQIAFSTEVITDSALEISETVLRGLDIHPVFEQAMKESEEVVVRRVVENSSTVDDYVRDSVEPVAVRKNGIDGPEWFLMPDNNLQLLEGDVIILKGSTEDLE